MASNSSRFARFSGTFASLCWVPQKAHNGRSNQLCKALAKGGYMRTDDRNLVLWCVLLFMLGILLVSSRVLGAPTPKDVAKRVKEAMADGETVKDAVKDAVAFAIADGMLTRDAAMAATKSAIETSVTQKEDIYPTIKNAVMGAARGASAAGQEDISPAIEGACQAAITAAAAAGADMQIAAQAALCGTVIVAVELYKDSAAAARAGMTGIVDGSALSRLSLEETKSAVYGGAQAAHAVGMYTRQDTEAIARELENGVSSAAKAHVLDAPGLVAAAKAGTADTGLWICCPPPEEVVGAAPEVGSAVELEVASAVKEGMSAKAATKRALEKAVAEGAKIYPVIKHAVMGAGRGANAAEQDMNPAIEEACGAAISAAAASGVDMQIATQAALCGAVIIAVELDKDSPDAVFAGMTGALNGCIDSGLCQEEIQTVVHGGAQGAYAAALYTGQDTDAIESKVEESIKSAASAHGFDSGKMVTTARSGFSDKGLCICCPPSKLAIPTFAVGSAVRRVVECCIVQGIPVRYAAKAAVRAALEEAVAQGDDIYRAIKEAMLGAASGAEAQGQGINAALQGAADGAIGAAIDAGADMKIAGQATLCGAVLAAVKLNQDSGAAAASAMTGLLNSAAVSGLSPEQTENVVYGGAQGANVAATYMRQDTEAIAKKVVSSVSLAAQDHGFDPVSMVTAAKAGKDDQGPCPGCPPPEAPTPEPPIIPEPKPDLIEPVPDPTASPV